MEYKNTYFMPPKAKRGNQQFNAACFPFGHMGTLRGDQAQRVWEERRKGQDFAAAEEEFVDGSACSDTSDSESDRPQSKSLLNVVVTAEVDGSVFRLYKGRMLLYEEAKALFYELLEKYRSNM